MGERQAISDCYLYIVIEKVDAHSQRIQKRVRLMLKWMTVLFALSGAVSTAAAENIIIELPENQEVATDQQLYKCGDKDIAVTYYNAGDISLAKLEMEDQTVVASNVLSGSGARYAGSIYIWWTKGDAADLYNLMEDPDQSKPVSCKQQ